MLKKVPLYAWQQAIKEIQDKKLQDFLNNDFKKKKFRNKYISNSEIKVIAEKYNLDLKDLTEIINEQNQIFIENEKANVLQELNSFLSSQTECIDNKDEIERKYNKDYCNYYEELNMDKKIDVHNNHIKFKEYDVNLINSNDSKIHSKGVNYYPNSNKPSQYKTDIHKFFR